MQSVVIVGASLAGFSAAKALRRLGFDGKVTLVGDEAHLPYQRPPLSKQFLAGGWDRARLDLSVGDNLQLEWLLQTRAQSLDLARHEVALSDKRLLRYDGLIVATGARARKPRWYADLQGVFTLRSVDDAIAMRAHVAAGKRNVAIVGAGFIGCETAATLRGLGCDVTLIDVDRLPMERVLGAELGGVCLQLHQSHGVHVVLGVAVDALVGSTAVEGVKLADGRVIEADCVIVGVGAVPNAWNGCSIRASTLPTVSPAMPIAPRSAPSAWLPPATSHVPATRITASGASSTGTTRLRRGTPLRRRCWPRPRRRPRMRPRHSSGRTNTTASCS